jgi:hypothetical protein
VNDRKTEIANFNKNNCNPEDVTVNGVVIRTKNTIKVLGVTMDTTLSWHEHVNNTVNNVQSKINAIRMIQRYFIADDLLQLLKMYCYP